MEQPKIMLTYMSNIIDGPNRGEKMTSKKSKFEFFTFHGKTLLLKGCFLWRFLVLPMSEYLFEQKKIEKVPKEILQDPEIMKVDNPIENVENDNIPIGIDENLEIDDNDQGP